MNHNQGSTYLTQTSKIIEHLKKHGKITSWEAIRLYGITRLSATIFILRERGHDIKTNNIEILNADKKVSTFAEYELKINFKNR